MTTALLETPTDFTPFELLEWVEFRMVVSGVDAMSRASILGTFPAGQGPDGAEMDQLFAEVRRRSDAAPSVYPFRDTGDVIALDRSIDSTAYRLLLVLSIEGAAFRRENRFTEINPDFELITREALIAYSGSGTKSVRFGWPNGDGRPEKLAEAVIWLAGQMGLNVGVVQREVDDDDKDGGIDVVSWKAFSDGAPSFSSWFAQCTVQSTFERKTGDVVPEKWAAWISMGKAPSSVLSVPFAIPLDAKLRSNIKYEVHLLLDRIRLCELLDSGSVNLADFAEYAHMQAWTTSEVDLTRASLNTPSSTQPRRAKIRRPARRPNPEEPVEAAP